MQSLCSMALRHLFRGLVASIPLATAGCSGDADVPPTNVAKVSILALGTEVSDQGLTIDTAHVWLDDLRFVPCDPKAAWIGTTDFPIDLLHDPPSSLTIETAVSDYCALHVALGPAPSGATSFEGSSAVGGHRKDGNDFSLTSAQTLTLDFDPATVNKLDARNLVLGIDFEAWFANADVNAAELTDDVAVIDADDNADTLAAFEGATSEAFALYVDADGDGTLTSDELEPVATATTP